MPSIWSDSVTMPSFPSMPGSCSTDVLIIGGGIAGILCAHMLHQKHCSYLLVEQNEIASGVTQNTTAKLTIHHGLLYQKLIQQVGIESAAMYLHANQRAMQAYQELCQNISCQYEQKANFLYATHATEQLEAEARALEALHVPYTYTTSPLPLPFSTAAAIRMEQQAQFHPLQFLAAITKPLAIYEHTKVQKIEGQMAYTNHGTIRFQKAIFATHFPFLNTHGSYFLKLYQNRSYVLALSNAPDYNGMYRDADPAGLSFRNTEGKLLIGGNAHRTGCCPSNWQPLRQFAEKYYPGATIEAQWAAQDCMSLDEIPYIGPYSKHTQNLYVATGFQKWGMTSSMVAALLLSAQVCGIEPEETPVFSPSRNMFHKQLFVNIGHTLSNFLIPTKKRCTHLGCALKWNAAEHTWECACHGSRFDANGVRLNNPANKDLHESH